VSRECEQQRRPPAGIGDPVGWQIVEHARAIRHLSEEWSAPESLCGRLQGLAAQIVELVGRQRMPPDVMG